jgi:hypothetical protein
MLEHMECGDEIKKTDFIIEVAFKIAHNDMPFFGATLCRLGIQLYAACLGSCGFHDIQERSIPTADIKHAQEIVLSSECCGPAEIEVGRRVVIAPRKFGVKRTPAHQRGIKKAKLTLNTFEQADLHPGGHGVQNFIRHFVAVMFPHLLQIRAREAVQNAILGTPAKKTADDFSGNPKGIRWREAHVITLPDKIAAIQADLDLRATAGHLKSFAGERLAGSKVDVNLHVTKNDECLAKADQMRPIVFIRSFTEVLRAVHFADGFAW